MQTRTHWTCTGPIAYRGQAALQHEIDTLKAFAAPEDTFLTTTAPASLEAYRRNEFYATQDEFVFALAEALRTEYEMVAAAGLIVQIDDAWLTAMWDRTGIAMGLEAFCGFGGRTHPKIAWAKLKSLADGASLASKALGYRGAGP